MSNVQSACRHPHLRHPEHPSRHPELPPRHPKRTHPVIPSSHPVIPSAHPVIPSAHPVIPSAPIPSSRAPTPSSRAKSRDLLLPGDRRRSEYITPRNRNNHVTYPSFSIPKSKQIHVLSSLDPGPWTLDPSCLISTLSPHQPTRSSSSIRTTQNRRPVSARFSPLAVRSSCCLPSSSGSRSSLLADPGDLAQLGNETKLAVHNGSRQKE